MSFWSLARFARSLTLIINILRGRYFWKGCRDRKKVEKQWPRGAIKGLYSNCNRPPPPSWPYMVFLYVVRSTNRMHDECSASHLSVLSLGLFSAFRRRMITSYRYDTAVVRYWYILSINSVSATPISRGSRLRVRRGNKPFGMVSKLPF